MIGDNSILVMVLRAVGAITRKHHGAVNELWKVHFHYARMQRLIAYIRNDEEDLTTTDPGQYRLTPKGQRFLIDYGNGKL